jgi:parallel beta-helix repeat protein
MKNNMRKKGIAFVIIALYTGAGIIPWIETTQSKNTTQGSQTTITTIETVNNNDDWPCNCTIFVDDDNKGGLSDGTREHPYQRIQQAIDNSNDGDIICVYNGTYIENIMIKNKRNLILYGEDKNTTIIDGNKTGHVIEIIDTADINISGFSITGSGQDKDEVDGRLRYLYHGIHINENPLGHKKHIIRNNIIFENGNGIKVSGCWNVSIENNTIHNNSDNGIVLTSTLGAIFVEKNYIVDNGREETGNNGDGIEIQRRSTGVIIRNNTIMKSRMDGIWDEMADDHEITGNHISYNDQWGINLVEASKCTISMNDIITNGHEREGEYSGGIHLTGGSTQNTIANNTIEKNYEHGIFIFESVDNKLLHNHIRKNHIGVHVWNSKHVRIYNNNITTNFLPGVILTSSKGRIYINWNNIYDNNNELGTNELIATSTILVDARHNWWGSWAFRSVRPKIVGIPIFFYIPWEKREIEIPLKNASLLYPVSNVNLKTT